MALNETSDYLERNFALLPKILMAVTFTCISILGVIENLVVLIVAFRKQNYRFVTNCYIINLAITDLLFLLISVPLTTYLALTSTWILSSLVSCRVHIYLAHVLLQATCYTLAVMSIDRYLYVTNSHPRPRWRTPLNACIICILIWFVSIAFIFPYASLFSLSSSETKTIAVNDCAIDSYHPLFASCLFPFCLYYVLPLVIIALCYSKIFFHTQRSSKCVSRHQNCLLSRPFIQLKRRRLTRTLFSLTCAFAICWLPIHTLEFLNCKHLLQHFYTNHALLLDTIRVLAHALSYFNSFLNPVLYALFNKDFFLQ